MEESVTQTRIAASAVSKPSESVPYDKRKLSYANTFTNPWKANTIRVMEWLTGKIPLIRLVRRFERAGAAEGQAFWAQALHHMGIDLETPEEQIKRIPKTGPVIIVANHPHGLVDGIVLGEVIGRVRTDYKILTRSLLTSVPEIEDFMIPVPFPHEEDAREQGLEMRRRSMEHLANGGVIVLFPSGVVASSKSLFGPAIEAQWNPFTAKMIHRSGAQVVPIHFPGQNSRAYQIANLLSPTLRQGLLVHEVMHACGKAQSPVVGHPIASDTISEWKKDPRGFVAWLREHTMNLGKTRG